MDKFNRTQLRFAGSALILSTLLTLVGLFLRGPLVTSAADAQAFAQSVSSPGNLIAETFLPLSLILQLFGFLGMYAYLQPAAPRAAFWGMVASILGNGLFLPFAGVFAFAMPVVGKLYLSGYSDSLRVAELALGPGPGLAYLFASAFALTLGGILFAVALWKTDGLPHWLPVIYLVQAFCLSFGASIAYGFEQLGGALLLLFSIAFGLKLWRK